MGNNKPIIRVGDRVKIITPMIVERIGYPLTPKMVLEELNTPENRQRVIDMLQDFELPVDHIRFDVFAGNILPEQVEGVLKIISYYTVRTRNFGGTERNLYRKDYPDLKDTSIHVDGKKIVRTGNRVPGYRCGDDWEPSYLDKPKSHVLLRFWGPDGPFNTKEMWIEACNVEKE